MNKKGGVRKPCLLFIITSMVLLLKFCFIIDYVCSTQKYWEHKIKSLSFVLFFTYFLDVSLLFTSDSTCFPPRVSQAAGGSVSDAPCDSCWGRNYYSYDPFLTCDEATVNYPSLILASGYSEVILSFLLWPVVLSLMVSGAV